MTTQNRISPHFNELEFIEALERTGCVRIEHVPHALTPVEPRGQLAAPDFDYTTNTVHGSVKDQGACADEPERQSAPEHFFIGLLWAGLLTLAMVASVARFAEWLVTGE